MRKIVLIFSIMMVAVFSAACGNNQEEEETLKAPPELHVLEVDLTITEKAEIKEDVDMSTVVTYGDRKVDDADEVVYEVWEEGKKSESEMIDAKNDGDGVYTASTSFEKDGLYNIQVHVTAEQQHTMPIEQVTIGDGGDYDDVSEHDYHTEGFMMHFMKPTNIDQEEASSLMVHIELNDTPLENLEVRYEIAYEDDEKHDWIDTEETADGEYVGEYQFEKNGQYHVTIHVEDDEELHEHEEHVIEVK